MKKKMKQLSIQYPGHHFHTVDLANEKEVSAWCEYVLNKIGTPYLLINNAGYIPLKVNLEDTPYKEFVNCLNVNVVGPFLTISKFLPAIKKNKKGIIITLSSGLGRMTAPHYGPYCTSKWAIEGLMSTISKEVEDPIVVCTYNPGTISTDMFAKNSSLTKEELIKQGMIGPQQWAEVSVPHMLSLNHHQHNGKQLDSPVANEAYEKGARFMTTVPQKLSKI